jgi:hypothetical protein
MVDGPVSSSAPTSTSSLSIVENPSSWPQLVQVPPSLRAIHMSSCRPAGPEMSDVVCADAPDGTSVG